MITCYWTSVNNYLPIRHKNPNQNNVPTFENPVINCSSVYVHDVKMKTP